MAPKDKLNLTFKLDPTQVKTLENAMAQLGKFSSVTAGLNEAKDASDALALAFAFAGKGLKPAYSATVTPSEAPVDSKTLKELLGKADQELETINSPPEKHKIKAERIKIVSDGTSTGTTIVTESGIPLKGCTEFTISLSAGGVSSCVMFFEHVSFELNVKSGLIEVLESES